MTRWHVVGPGAVGCLWAASLKRARASEVFLVDKVRNAGDVGPVEQKSLQINVQQAYLVAHSSDQPPHYSANVQVCQSDGSSGRIQNLLVCTKAKDAAPALLQLQGQFGSNPNVVLLCNGALGAMDDIQKLQLGYNVILGSNTHGSYISSRSNEEINLVHAGFGELELGTLTNYSDENSESLQSLNTVVDSLNTTGLQVRTAARGGPGGGGGGGGGVRATLWRKLAANACLNPLTALLECRNGLVVAGPAAAAAAPEEEGAALCAQVCDEVARVAAAAAWVACGGQRGPGGVEAGGEGPGTAAAAAAAEGCPVLGREALLAYVMDVAAKNAGNYSSTYQDIVVKRVQSEIPYLNGYIVKKAKELGLEVPCNEMLTNLIMLKQKQNIFLREEETKQKHHIMTEEESKRTA